MAPSRPLFSVPSSSIIAASMSAWSSASMPRIVVGDLAVDRLDRLVDALAAPAALVAVAQFDRLVRAGRRARRHRRAAEAAVLQQHIDLDRRIAAAVEDRAGVEVDDCGHVTRLLSRGSRRALSRAAAGGNRVAPMRNRRPRALLIGTKQKGPFPMASTPDRQHDDTPLTDGRHRVRDRGHGADSTSKRGALFSGRGADAEGRSRQADQHRRSRRPRPTPWTARTRPAARSTNSPS